jgi:hypothetical protein
MPDLAAPERPPLWRLLLIEIPANMTEVAMVWYRVYLTVILFIGGPILTLSVLVMLLLPFVFGIRWGW